MLEMINKDLKCIRFLDDQALITTKNVCLYIEFATTEVRTPYQNIFSAIIWLNLAFENLCRMFFFFVHKSN